MKYRKWITMICAAFMLCACTSKQPEKKKTNTISHVAKQKEEKINSIPQPALNTEEVSAVVMDAETGKVYYAKNEQESRYPASTIKLLSALVAIEYYKDDDLLTTKNIMSLPDRVFAYTEPVHDDEQIPFKDVIRGMLLKSSNEMALTLAENYQGGYDAFINAMNKKAKKLGCQKVEVSNPHGLSYAQKGWLKETCSTKDMALIAKAFYKNKELRNIISTPNYTFESNQYRTMQNVKMTQQASPYYDERVIGGKTGFTNLAKRCLVTYSKVKNKTIITVVFKENSREETYTDTKKLLDYVNEVLAA